MMEISAIIAAVQGLRAASQAVSELMQYTSREPSPRELDELRVEKQLLDEVWKGLAPAVAVSKNGGSKYCAHPGCQVKVQDSLAMCVHHAIEALV